MRRALVAALFVLATGTGAVAQTPQQIHANAVIPDPLPTAPIAHWTNAKGRTTTSLTVNGAILRGWSYAGTDPKAPTVVFFNRNGTTIDRNDASYRAIAALGPPVVVYDYRGYGFSVGIPGVQLMQDDAVHIVDAVAKDAGARGIVLYGFSLGTSVATYVAARTPVAGVILAGTPASAQEELPIVLAAGGVPAAVAAALTPAPDAVAAFGVADNAGRIQAPLLILHGTADTDVPIAQAREVYAASVSVPKRLVEVPGATHEQTVDAPEARAAVKAFITGLEH
jgi:uncharacterized protein